MVKVIKKTSLELLANFEEFFDGATIEEATKKAYDQKMPSEAAKINITENRVISANIKPVGEENNESKEK